MKNTVSTFFCFLILGIFLFSCAGRAQRNTAAAAHRGPAAVYTQWHR